MFVVCQIVSVALHKAKCTLFGPSLCGLVSQQTAERSLPLIGKQMILPASSITLNLLSVVKVYILCILLTYVEFDIFKNNIHKCDLGMTRTLCFSKFQIAFLCCGEGHSVAVLFRY